MKISKYNKHISLISNLRSKLQLDNPFNQLVFFFKCDDFSENSIIFQIFFEWMIQLQFRHQM